MPSPAPSACSPTGTGDTVSGRVSRLPIAAEWELGGLWLKLQKVCLFPSTVFPPWVGSFPPMQPDLPLQRDPHPQLPCRKPPTNRCKGLGHCHTPQLPNVPCISPRPLGSHLLQPPRSRRQRWWSLQLAAIPTASPLHIGTARCSWSQISLPYAMLCVTV